MREDSRLALRSEYEQKLHKDLAVCKRVKDTVDSKGWQEIIGPLIDRMIMDIVGGKIGNEWVSGTLDKARKDERREYFVGYKQALIDLHKRVMNYIKQITLKEDELQAIIKDKENKGYVMPMEDTKYAVD